MQNGTMLSCASDMLPGPQRNPRIVIQKATINGQHELQMLRNVMGCRMTKQYMFLANMLLGLEISRMCFK